MSAVSTSRLVRKGVSQTARLAALEAALSEMRAASDVTGLLQVQALASALAEQAGGTVGRKAARVAKKASSSATELRRAGALVREGNGARVAGAGSLPRPDDGRALAPVPAPRVLRDELQSAAGAEVAQEPEAPKSLPVASAQAREAHESRRAARPDAVMFGRLSTLLQLLAGAETELPTGRSALDALSVRGDDGLLRVEFSDLVRSWTGPLAEGFEHGRRLAQRVPLGVLRDQHQRQIERELKMIAVEAMSHGVDVSGLTADTVPLVAYALLVGRIPAAGDPGSAEAEELRNNLLLGVAGDAAALPAVELAPVFLDLVRLAAVLGEAQRYAEELSLTSLSFDEAPPRAMLGGYTVGVVVAVGGAALAALLIGFVLGAAGGHKSARGKTTTVIHTRVVTHTRVVPRTTIVTRTKSIPHTTTVTRDVPQVTTVTLTTTVHAAPAVAAPAVVKDVVPASCAQAIGDARAIALLAVGDFNLFSEYAKLASQAIPAAVSRDSATMASLTAQTDSIGSSLSQRAEQIARLGQAFDSSAAACS